MAYYAILPSSSCWALEKLLTVIRIFRAKERSVQELCHLVVNILSIKSLMYRDSPVIRCMQAIYHLIYVCCPPSARRLEISSPLRLKSGTTCNFALQKKCLQPTGLPACNLYHLRRQFASPGPQVIAKQRKRVSQEGLLGAGLIESGTRYGGSP